MTDDVSFFIDRRRTIILMVATLASSGVDVNRVSADPRPGLRAGPSVTRGVGGPDPAGVHAWAGTEGNATPIAQRSAGNEEGSTVTADADANALADHLLPFAEHMLRKNGEFFPFGATMDAQGEISAAMASDGRKHPPSAELIDMMKEKFREGARRGRHRATAVAFDVRTTVPTTGAKSDAIAIAFDHRDGTSVVIHVPYSLKGGQPAFGEIFVIDGKNDIFERP